MFFYWENNIITVLCPLGEKHKDWCAQVIKIYILGKKRNKERTQP